jgi:FemAB-related protein (PEP-CTERM system-associated)
LKNDHQQITIRRLTSDRRRLWDNFVESNPAATFFHKAGWQDVIERSFGHRTDYLYAQSHGEIIGILPLVQINSRLFGNAIVSTAFCVHGGPVATDSTVAEALIAEGMSLADARNVDFFECRSSVPKLGEWQTRSDLYVSFRRPIDPDPEQNMHNIPRKQRAMVRKGIKLGLISEIDESVDRFYDIYATSVRNLGTPVFSKSYFRNLKQTFRDECEILTVRNGKEAVSSVMSFYFRDQVLPYYGGGTSGARQVAGNDFMYWELMRHACLKDLKWFDFGRSKVGTGSFNFKKNWGFSPEPLEYSYLLRRLDRFPEINPNNPKYRYFIALWKRLPLLVSKAVGPLIARNLG